MALPINLINRISFACYILLIVFSIIELGLAAHAASVFNNGPFDFLAFASAFSFAVLLVWVILGNVGGFTESKHAVVNNIVEVCMLGLLWVFWLAGAAAVTATTDFSLCGKALVDWFGDYIGTVSNSVCAEGRADLAFAWLNWIIVTILFGTLLTLCIIETTKKNNNVWYDNSRSYPWFNTTSANNADVEAVGAPATNTATTSAFVSIPLKETEPKPEASITV